MDKIEISANYSTIESSEVTRDPEVLDISENSIINNIDESHDIPIKTMPEMTEFEEKYAIFKAKCQDIINHKYFDQFIMFVIILNSVLMAMGEYKNVDDNGDLKTQGSIRNTLIESAELYFLLIFTVEMILKMVGLGVGYHGTTSEKTYFKDYWNMLDFTVVFAGWVAMTPGVPSVSVLRTFRALRPLRSVNALPELKALVICVLNSIPQLASVLILLGFVFILFGVGGVQMFGGPMMHARCRLTPWPVNTSWVEGMDPMDDSYKCLPGQINFDVPEDDHSMTKAGSPWATPQNCYWPIDTSEFHEKFCALPGWTGYHVCHHDTHHLNVTDWRWCGSDYDALGNHRFIKNDHFDRSDYIFKLNWGFTNFDNIARAFVTIFQCITEEGWSDITYMVQDSCGHTASIFFVLLMIFGAFFVLNLVLAVLEENFQNATNEVANDDKGKGANAYIEDVINIMCPFPWEEWPWRVKVRNLVKTDCFEQFITSCIILNTISLSMDHYPMDQEFGDILEAINFGLTLVFLIEMILKLLGLGLTEYVKDSFNVFDAMVVVLSVVSAAIAPPILIFGGPRNEDGASLSVLRSFRLFRVFKLVTRDENMKALLTKIGKTVADMSYFGILLFLFIYIFTLVGMQFFANRFRFDENGYALLEINSQEWHDSVDRPRSNFDGFTHAFASTFQIITTENWNNIMYDCWRASGSGAIFYCIIVVILGTFLLKNLFLAILLCNFSREEDDKIKDSEDKDNNANGARTKDFDSSVYDDVNFSKANVSVFPLNPARSLGIFGPLNPVRDFCAHLISKPIFDQFVLMLIIVSTITLILDDPLADPNSSTMQILYYFDIVMTVLFSFEMMTKIIALGFVYQEGAYLRNGWNVLDYVIVVISVLSLSTAHAGSGFKGLKALRALRALRPLRMINRAPGLKVVVNSFIAAIPDVVNVGAICMLFLLIFAIFGVSTFKGQFRDCQGDNIDAYVRGDKDMMHLLENPIPWSDMDSKQRAWFTTTDYSSTGLYSGTCSTDFLAGKDVPCCPIINAYDTPTGRDICECWGGEWTKLISQQFDNVILAMISFFEVSTTEGWVDVMYAAADSTGINMQPIRDAYPGWIYFFIIYVILSNFLAVNLFVGVVIDNFNSMKQKVEDGSLMFLTREQREWIKTQEMTKHLKPTRVLPRPENVIMGICYDIDRTSWFEKGIQISIVSNTFLLAIQYFGQSDTFTIVVFWINVGFAIIFTLEMFIKLLSQRLDYFKSNWNIFDCFLTILNDFGVIYAFVSSSNTGMVISVIRTFRVVRIVRAMKRLEKVNQLIDTLIYTLPGLANIAALLMLLFIIYGVMGVQFFAKVEYHESVDSHANFRDFGTATLTLLRFATGEAWGNFMYDLSNKNDECHDDPEYDPNMCGFNDRPGCVPLNGCGSLMSYPFMISFTLLVSFVYLNLFIGYILEGFSAASHREEGIRPQDFPKFAEHWSLFDPGATCYIEISQLFDFIHTLYAPLGFDGDPSVSKHDIMIRISSFKLSNYDGKLHFKDVLRAVSAAALKRKDMQLQLDAAAAAYMGNISGAENDEKGKKGADSAGARRAGRRSMIGGIDTVEDAKIYEQISRNLTISLNPNDLEMMRTSIDGGFSMRKLSARPKVNSHGSYGSVSSGDYNGSDNDKIDRSSPSPLSSPRSVPGSAGGALLYGNDTIDNSDDVNINLANRLSRVAPTPDTPMVMAATGDNTAVLPSPVAASLSPQAIEMQKQYAREESQSIIARAMSSITGLDHGVTPVDSSVTSDNEIEEDLTIRSIKRNSPSIVQQVATKTNDKNNQNNKDQPAK